MRNIWNRICYNAEGGAGGTPAPAAGTPAPAASPTPAPAAGTPTPSPAPAAWYDKFNDPALSEFAINKGYNKGTLDEIAPNMLRSYQSLEKLVGADKAGRTVEIPDFEKGDEASLNAFYDRIGRPKDAAGYDLKIPVDGKVDTDFSNAMAGVMHKAGIPARQASALAQAYQEFGASRDAANVIADQQRFADEDKSLKQEWGAKYDDNMKLASAAATQLGVDPKALDALQKAAGYGAAMKMFQQVASKIGEDTFITGERTNNDGKMTPAEAKVAIKSFLGDKDVRSALMDKYHPKHAEYMARKAQLSSWEVGQ